MVVVEGAEEVNARVQVPRRRLERLQQLHHVDDQVDGGLLQHLAEKEKCMCEGVKNQGRAQAPSGVSCGTLSRSRDRSRSHPKYSNIFKTAIFWCTPTSSKHVR